MSEEERTIFVMTHMKTILAVAAALVVGAFALARSDRRVPRMEKPMPMKECQELRERHDKLLASMEELDRQTENVDARHVELQREMAALMPEMMRHMPAHMDSALMLGMAESLSRCPTLRDHRDFREEGDANGRE